MPTRPLHPPPATTYVRFPWHHLGDVKGASARERRASFAGASALLLVLTASLAALGCSSSVSSSSGGTGGSSSTTTSSSTSAGGAGGEATSSASSSSSAASSSSGTGGAACVPVDDSNPCTDDVCISGVPTSTPKAAGSHCATAGQCDGMGTCVTSACAATLGLPVIPSLSVSANPSALTAADIDGDGKADIITANADDTVGVLRTPGQWHLRPRGHLRRGHEAQPGPGAGPER